MPPLPLAIYVALTLGIIVVFLKFRLIPKEKASENPQKTNSNEKTDTWPKLPDGLLEFGITITATFVSFYGSHVMQLHKTKDTDKNDAFEMCQSSQQKLAQFEDYLSKFVRPRGDSTKIFFRADSALLKYFVNRYPDNYKPYYILDQIPQNQILTYLSQPIYYILAAMEVNEKSALRTTLAEKAPVELRIRTLYAAYQFDFLRRYVLEAQRKFVVGEISPDSLSHMLTAAVDSNVGLVNLIHPAFYNQDTTNFPLQ